MSPLLIDENGEKLLHALYFTRWSTTSKTTSEEDLCKMVVKGDMVTYEGLTLAEHTAEAQRYYAEDDKVNYKRVKDKAPAITVPVVCNPEGGHNQDNIALLMCERNNRNGRNRGAI